ncbi:hypothetical protein M430DRAFT_58764 [Amorphotheca resinae ATCC 22711]|uniref:Xaa-Pro aminopeptidase n=1 Tax=Amorphotheca resinae ATCC 22711 TaxID=857342 RepID=A0A2T3B253_AMORE|nr:hypothetical protein M430DRAFT_58764 [Amorphotheca resinae ATCC 22711]PSS18640.1 hypothetical protein M430DRAFT_58764 [Amorphotheca resinae ATCC 22711]
MVAMGLSKGNQTGVQQPAMSEEDFSCVDVAEFDAISINLKPKPSEKYPGKLHAQSVAKRLGSKQGLIYLPSKKSCNYEDSDQEVFFRQRRYFYYLSGVDLPNCVVTYNIEKDSLTLFIPPPNSGTSVIFNGSSPTPEEIKAKYDFDAVELTTALPDFLTHFAHREKGMIYVLHPYQIPPKSTIMQSITLEDGCQSNLYIPPWETSKLQPTMDAARTIKSPYELKMIRKANEISAQAHLNVLRGIKHFKNEAEVEAVFAATCIARQAKRQAYGIIAGAGENASTLHYVANNEPLEGRQLLCLDAGCEWDCYASDVTRTFPISGAFTPEAQAIYDLVAQMQEECIAMCKPGVNFRSIHLHAHAVAAAGLMKLGLLHNGTFDEIFKSGASVAFFPHGLGHFLGLEVHDVGDGTNSLLSTHAKSWLTNFHSILQDPSSSSVSVLAPNMVITIEPGM